MSVSSALYTTSHEKASSVPYNPKHMSESFFVSLLLGSSIKFPWQNGIQLSHTTELKVTHNRVDIVYFEEKEAGEVGAVVAVEAKLKDWKKALRQAYRNHLFADRVYVALPSAHASSAIKNISQFRQTSVGLIVWEDSRAKVYYHPPKNRSVSRWHASSVRTSLEALVSGK